MVLKRKAAEEPERQLVAQRLLKLRVRKTIQPLQIKRLEHRQSVVGRTAIHAGPNLLRQGLQEQPINQPFNRFQLLVRSQPRINKCACKPELFHCRCSHRRNDGITNHQSPTRTFAEESVRGDERRKSNLIASSSSPPSRRRSGRPCPSARSRRRQMPSAPRALR